MSWEYFNVILKRKCSRAKILPFFRNQNSTNKLTTAAKYPNMTIIVGCKVSVKHQDTYRTAEILQIRATDNASLEYYVHFINFNKRLDTWVGHELLDMDTLEQPETKAGEKQDHHAGVSKKESKKNKKRKRVSSPIVPAEKEEEKEGTDEEPEGFSKEREIEKLRVGIALC